MYIRRKVFSVAYDENGNEKLFSTTIKKEEENKTPKKKIKKSDKARIWMNKKLATKGDRKATIAAYDKETQDFKPLAKRTGSAAAIGTGIVSVPAGALLIGGKKGAAFGAGAAIGAGLGAAGGTRLGGKLVGKIREKSEKMDKKYQKTADIAKVANGDMSEEEFAEKYGKEPKKKNFSDSTQENKSSIGKKVAVGTGAVAGLGAAAYGGEKALNKVGDFVVNKVTNKRENGKFRKLTGVEKKIRDLGIKARDTKNVQNLVKKVTRRG